MIKNIFSFVLLLCGLVVGMTLLNIFHVPLIYPYAGIIVSTLLLFLLFLKSNNELVQ